MPSEVKWQKTNKSIVVNVYPFIHISEYAHPPLCLINVIYPHKNPWEKDFGSVTMVDLPAFVALIGFNEHFPNCKINPLLIPNN